ncbi:putative eka-like protein [Erysiphe necator]|uniref:Putative eka-like protein n=1 Tax=Uncinula necator TaxID=52586 RepID=A0A0B1PBP1_UNCNE|nr:putative eka-like protein [Erysiphe necator]
MADSMEISTESQAPSTDTSKQPPPIPSVPPIHNPPIIIASPPPSNLTPSYTSLVGRQILKPVIPSKRPIPENSIQNSTNNSDAANAFLLKELTEIVANRQRQVTVAIPRTIKGAVTSEENTQQAHKLPKPPQLNERTWATVVRNGQKKARVTLSMKTQAAPISKATQRVANKRNFITTAPTDQRLFVRIPQEHEWRKLSPAGIREIIVQKLSISPSLIGKIKPIQSGFALSPCSTEARQTI